MKKKVLINYDKYKFLISNKIELIKRFNKIEDKMFKISAKNKRLEKSNAELLQKVIDRNDEIEETKKIQESYKKTNNKLANQNLDLIEEIERRENDLEKVRNLNLDLMQQRPELQKLKSKWYVKLFYREKRIKVDYEVVEKDKHRRKPWLDTFKYNETWYNHFINRHDPAGLPPVHININKNADDNKLGEIKNQPDDGIIASIKWKKQIPKYRIKKIIWKNKVNPGYIDGYISGIKIALFHIGSNSGRSLLWHELHNGGRVYLSYGSLIQAQESAQAILRKYVFRFLEG